MNALAVLARGFRNGAYYGTKIRAPHALVMTFLFRSGDFLSKLDGIARLTFEHTVNLAKFVGVYKTVLLLGQWSEGESGRATITGLPAKGVHAFIAGCIGGYLIWGNQTAVNYQIVLYLLSRVLVAIVKVLASRKIYPFSSVTETQVFPWFAAGVWGAIMYLFETHERQVNSSLAASMRFLYHDSVAWSSYKDFLPSLATTVIVAYYLFRQSMKR